MDACGQCRQGGFGHTHVFVCSSSVSLCLSVSRRSPRVSQTDRSGRERKLVDQCCAVLCWPWPDPDRFRIGVPFFFFNERHKTLRRISGTAWFLWEIQGSTCLTSVLRMRILYWRNPRLIWIFIKGKGTWKHLVHTPWAIFLIRRNHHRFVNLPSSNHWKRIEDMACFMLGSPSASGIEVLRHQALAWNLRQQRRRWLLWPALDTQTAAPSGSNWDWGRFRNGHRQRARDHTEYGAGHILRAT